MKIGNHHEEDAAAQKMGAARPYVGWIKLDWKFDGFATREASAPSAAGWKTSRGCQTIFQLPVSTRLMWIYGIISSPRKWGYIIARYTMPKSDSRVSARISRLEITLAKSCNSIIGCNIVRCRGRRGELKNFLTRVWISNFPWEALSL